MAKVKCEHCGEPTSYPGGITPDQVREQVQGLLKELPKSPSLEQVDGLLQKHFAELKPQKHKPADHETYDAMLDCPECIEWAKRTGKRWVLKETPEPPKTKEAAKPHYKIGALRPSKGGE